MRNVDLVRRGLDAFNRGDVEGSLESIHPEIEWHTYVVPGPGGGVYHGHDGVRELWSDAKRIFDGFCNIPERLIDVPPDRVVAFILMQGVGRESGVAVEARIAHVYTVRDGKLARVESFPERQDALRAVGLDSVPD